MIKSYFISELTESELNKDLKDAKIIKIEVLNEKCFKIFFSGNRMLDFYSDENTNGCEFKEEMLY